MATKLQYITELSEKTALDVTVNHTNWTLFLKTAANNHKYSFWEQILIFAQRPDATACAEMDEWNKTVHRWVKGGSKGIALINDSGPRLQLRHVFDISDTDSHGSRPFVIWKMKDGYEDAVTETLENAFGSLEDSGDLPTALIATANNAVDDNFSDYLSELMECRGESFLEELDDLNVEIIFKEILKSSVAFMLLSRCGYIADEYLTSKDFQNIANFNTLNTVSGLGAATSDISEMILREIGSTVRNRMLAEIRQGRTFAKRDEARHNKGGNQNERNGDYGTDLHAAGRLPDARPDTAGRKSPDRQIWDVAQNISEKSQAGDVREPDDVGQDHEPPVGDRPGGEGAGRADNGAVTGEQTRTGQESAPNGMGGTYEQPEASGGGDGTGRTGLQLSLLPSEQEQIEAIEKAEDKKSSAFSIPESEIAYALSRGTGFQDGKFRVYEHYQENHTNKETADFLKHEYGIGGGTHTFLNGTSGSVWSDGKGFSISKEFSVTNPDLRLTWNQVAIRLGVLIVGDRYLNSKEKEYLPVYERQIEERRRQLAEQAYAREIMGREPVPTEQEQSSRENLKYTFSLGAAVYIGADEYEICSFEGDVVELRDMRFPLLTETFKRDVFEQVLRENPLNDHLISPEQSAGETDGTGTLHAGDANTPEWLHEIGDVTITRAGDTVTIEKDDGTDGKSYVELDVEVPDSGNEQSKQEPAEKEIAVGLELTIEDRRYAIDSIDAETGTVSLRDITFQKGTGFPIFRKEYLGFVRGILEKQTEPIWQKTRDGEVTKVRIDLVPKTPKQPRFNFHITNDDLGVGGQKTKYSWNIAAIRLLNQLEEEERLATPEEQEILSKYVGWGALPQAFDEKNGQWAKEYTELTELLTDEEYTSARASTLNAHYTSPIVIKAIYTCLKSMGFQRGNVLEPACGVGNFLGLVPESMKDSRLYGVELDSITGRIAKQLYQQANIAVQGFEETNLPDSFFDLVIGNVPFGSYGVADKKYDKNKFLIHDYFFAKALDKTRPGGIVAFITSKGTLDKQSSEVRRYIAQRAELLGAVRLPNNAFFANAGTEVTADILFLQKRDRPVDVEPDWLHLTETEDGVPINQYFADHPDMVLGTMAYDEGMYGNRNETTCVPIERADLAEQLSKVMENIHGEITEYELDDIGEGEDKSIPADPGIRNFSFCIVEGRIYYRENSRMNPVDTSVTAQGRIKGMIALRDCVRDLIYYQTEDFGDDTIKEQQLKLNRLYDAFTKTYGLINSRGNSLAFSDDSSYCLLCSLEIIDENGELERKADMFSKRTIRQRTTVTHVDTAAEALAISIAEKAGVDLGFMQSLTGLSVEQLELDLQGVIFRDLGDCDPTEIPGAFFDLAKCPFVTADAYLSGNVRNKLRLAGELAKMRPDLAEELETSIRALEAVQPKDLSASEIDVRMGATWLPADVIRDFMFELLETPHMCKRYIDVFYSGYTANWSIKGKNDDRSNIKANITYGTERANAYKIIEDSLNLKDVRIFDTMRDADGKETRVLNKKETILAQQKQEAVKEAFQSWIWKDPARRERLTRLYNDRFNSIRPREYDGSHIKFTAMNPEITLRKHQVDAVAHAIYGGNTLLAHCVGAGKTYEMTAIAMESKHLGLCNKSMFVVPNHLIEQWAGEFLQLYPSANILVATKKDFESKNRKKFCSRIATGDYDAVIIGHSQFEKIPISAERQRRQLEEQIFEVTNGIRELKEERSERYAIKDLEKTKKALELKLKKLNDTARKDDVVTFEELGVDRLFIDEADFYKNRARRCA